MAHDSHRRRSCRKKGVLKFQPTMLRCCIEVATMTGRKKLVRDNPSLGFKSPPRRRRRIPASAISGVRRMLLVAALVVVVGILAFSLIAALK
ncbi:hypothetical protein [Rhizobium sp. 9140]|uniref:hypothetical protein n=1 Tax=Rhizobium sp. 9140 TaxID=1761900 RepID=UPI001111DCFB|nr:hypothetical protein [Rhizobium sp. 9140]